MPWDIALILFILAVLIPWRGVMRMRKLAALKEVSSRDRLRLYLSAILAQWILTAVVGWRVIARGFTTVELGLVIPGVLKTLLYSAIGVGFFAWLHWSNLKRAANRTGLAGESLRKVSSRILPRSKLELSVFIVLALTAGICEEFLYRGFMMAALLRVGVPGWATLLATSVLFGFAHLYQGRGGVMGTTLVGLIFGTARIAYGSIAEVVAWHATLDVVAGVAGPRYFPERPSAS